MMEPISLFKDDLIFTNFPRKKDALTLPDFIFNQDTNTCQFCSYNINFEPTHIIKVGLGTGGGGG